MCRYNCSKKKGLTNCYPRISLALLLLNIDIFLQRKTSVHILLSGLLHS